jgi:hypothetical protein
MKERGSGSFQLMIGRIPYRQNDRIVVGWFLILDYKETEQVNFGLRITIFNRPDVKKYKKLIWV